MVYKGREKKKKVQVLILHLKSYKETGIAFLLRNAQRSSNFKCGTSSNAV